MLDRGYNREGGAHVERHLCAWGNDAASEVIPRRVNCWLKTIPKPPLWLSLCGGPLRISERAPFPSGEGKALQYQILNLFLAAGFISRSV